MWVEGHSALSAQESGHAVSTDELAAQVLKLLNRGPNQQYDEDVEYKRQKPYWWNVWSDNVTDRKVRRPISAYPCSAISIFTGPISITPYPLYTILSPVFYQRGLRT